jgi:hypothetical protein
MFALCGNRTRVLLRSRRVFPPLRHTGRQMDANGIQLGVQRKDKSIYFRYSETIDVLLSSIFDSVFTIYHFHLVY